MEQAVDVGRVVEVDMVVFVLTFLVEVDMDELAGMVQFPKALWQPVPQYAGLEPQ
jgi:hypothetical protein